MVEREIERRREPEPKIIHYDVLFDYYQKLISEHRKGKRLVKWKTDTYWEQNRQALCRYWTSPANWDERAAPGWNVFMQRVLKQSGKHTHQGGLPIYVVEGKGYSVVDGVRYDWKKGDLLILFFKPGGTEHQHFNEDPDKPPVWIALRFLPFSDYAGGQIKQVETHPDWQGK